MRVGTPDNPAAMLAALPGDPTEQSPETQVDDGSTTSVPDEPGLGVPVSPKEHDVNDHNHDDANDDHLTRWPLRANATSRSAGAPAVPAAEAVAAGPLLPGRGVCPTARGRRTVREISLPPVTRTYRVVGS